MVGAEAYLAWRKVVPVLGVHNQAQRPFGNVLRVQSLRQPPPKVFSGHIHLPVFREPARELNALFSKKSNSLFNLSKIFLT